MCRSHGNSRRRDNRTGAAPSRSWMSAVWTLAPSRFPSVSVTIWRLRPLTFLPASYPRGPATSVVLADWLSMIPALGLASHPTASRAACTK